MKTAILKTREKLQKKLKADRFEHTIGVAYTAACMAMRYGCDLEQAEMAGLLHDCARQYSNKEILEKCIEQQLEVTEAEQENLILLHAKLGAWMAINTYGIADREIADAIRYHTTGKAEMSLLEKIIYTADYIEPRRDQAPNLAEIRHLAFQDLDECVYKIMHDTLAYLEQSGGIIDPTTAHAYAYYQELHERKEQ